MSQGVLPIFFPKSFIASGLSFRSLIYSEFIFVCGVRECSHFILLCPVSPTSLIKETIFSPLYTPLSFVKDKMPIGM